MHRALKKLSTRPEFVLVDGNRFKPFEDIPFETVVHGDATYASIAAASVLAVISAVLLAASIAGRVMNRPKDGQEQLQLSERRNYTEEVPEDERVMIADESENAPEAEEKPETAETADAVQTADDVAANEKPASAEAQQVFTADDMAEDGDAMEDAKAQIYGRSKRGRQ